MIIIHIKSEPNSKTAIRLNSELDNSE